MEILLIGNGFDLEHNLPTSYNDFLDFCKKARRIYTLENTITLQKYQSQNLENCEINDCIKKTLSNAFEKRKCTKKVTENDTAKTEVTTPYSALDELYTHINHNTWIDYFITRTAQNSMGENWIDFESEISKVIQALGVIKYQINSSKDLTNVDKDIQQIALSIFKASGKSSMQGVFKDIHAIDLFISFLDTELDRLIRALEIYIAEFVRSIPITKKSADIETLTPDHVLSFNYSDTFERIYGNDKAIKYDYIHGKADINKTLLSCNLVLGIDKYSNVDGKDEELEFLPFKKFYQRIYKSTGNTYLNWVDEIKDGYTDYLQKERDTNLKIIESFKDGSFDHFPFEREVCMESFHIQCPQHTVYIFGHSLDITDRDVLKLFICNDNVQTKIFYYRENEDDKSCLAKLIKNLIRIMGQDELIRRTGGAHKTIEFIPQTLSIHK